MKTLKRYSQRNGDIRQTNNANCRHRLSERVLIAWRNDRARGFWYQAYVDSSGNVIRAEPEISPVRSVQAKLCKSWSDPAYEEFVERFTAAIKTAVEAPSTISSVISPPQLASISTVALMSVSEVDIAAITSFAQLRDALIDDAGIAGTVVIECGLVQRQLRKAANNISDPNSAHLAGSIRTQLLSVADKAMPGFHGTRGFYRLQIAAEDALEHGRKLGPKSKTFR